MEEMHVQDSLVETVHMVRPNHLNAAGRLFGGILMQWLDEVAGLVAKRHTRSNVITFLRRRLTIIQTVRENRKETYRK